MRRLRPLLMETGVRAEAADQWTSHCFRRGSGVDTLESEGVSAMLEHGGWASPRSAEPHASADEQRAVAFAAAQLMVDDSEEDA